MAIVTVDDFMECKVTFQHTKYGSWVERYNHPGITYAAVEANFVQLINYRNTLLGLDISIIDAVMSNAKTLGTSWPPAGYDRLGRIIDAETDIEECNDLDVGFLYRLDTDEGRFSSRHIRGIRDSWVEGVERTAAAPAVVYSAAVTPAFVTIADNMSGTDAISGYLYTLRDYFCHIRKIGVGSWERTPYANFEYQAVSHHDTGHSAGSRKARRKKPI